MTTKTNTKLYPYLHFKRDGIVNFEIRNISCPIKVLLGKNKKRQFALEIRKLENPTTQEHSGTSVTTETTYLIL